MDPIASSYLVTCMTFAPMFLTRSICSSLDKVFEASTKRVSTSLATDLISSPTSDTSKDCPGNLLKFASNTEE